MTTSEDIERLLEQLESVASSPPQDPELQQRLYNAAQKLTLAVEAPLDTVYRVIYSVRREKSVHDDFEADKPPVSSQCFSVVLKQQRTCKYLAR